MQKVQCIEKKTPLTFTRTIVASGERIALDMDFNWINTNKRKSYPASQGFLFVYNRVIGHTSWLCWVFAIVLETRKKTKTSAVKQQNLFSQLVELPKGFSEVPKMEATTAMFPLPFCRSPHRVVLSHFEAFSLDGVTIPACRGEQTQNGIKVPFQFHHTKLHE